MRHENPESRSEPKKPIQDALRPPYKHRKEELTPLNK